MRTRSWRWIRDALLSAVRTMSWSRKAAITRTSCRFRTDNVMQSFQFQALAGLIARYAAIFRETWAQRSTYDAPARLADEIAFQPAHLELLETPAHPAAHWAIR